ncbi:hypothetical protein J2S43_004392 [Catenuloplanes nepalensis]|uniref:Uncharacterized protein n=1 Tax=Catenuloplanes nepalensis TaxID=587533 RepID=A0ABT9MWR6_9ACTN|nr:hypothetical protein [Catenuloplanes nepalensis]MDP9795880.1 hypothetical protein [Catenuloplanes nepalensis]
MSDPSLLSAVAAAVATGLSSGPAFDVLSGVVRDAVGAPPASGLLEDRIAAVYNGLLDATARDPELVPRLTRLWDAVAAESSAAPGAVSNTVTGNVSGAVVQARDVHGGINLGRPHSSG